jgi:FkbM family methyltransferase
MKIIYDKANDFSQHGTQKLIFEYFGKHPPRHNLLADVGAFGRFLSNSFGLLKLGWKGLLIEPNPDRLKIIESEFAGLAVDILNVGIGDVSEIIPFHLHTTVGYDSFDPAWACADKSGKILAVYVFPLAYVLKEKKYPLDFDLLSVDTEGFDFKIIAALFKNSDFRPRLIVTEANSYPDAVGLFKGFGYSLHALAGAPEDGNLIFSKDV